MDMVERVARAIDPEVWADDLPTPTRAATVAFHGRRQEACAKARAAIEAMRTPTPQMKMVSQGVFMNAAKNYTIEDSDWHRIIDAALSPSGEK